MRACLFILILCVVVTTVSGQQDFPGLNKRFVIATTTIRFDSLLQQVSRQTGIKFSINTRKIPPSRNIRLIKKTGTVRELLDLLTVQTRIYYTTIGGHIILVETPPAAVKKPGPQLVAKDSRPVLPKQPHTEETPGRVPDRLEPALLPMRQLNIQHDSIYAGLPALSLQAIPLYQPPPPVVTPADKKTGRYHPFAAAGVGMDDIFYANVTIRAGFPFLYGIASFGTNFHHSGIRYGAGTSYKLNSVANVHLRFLVGNYNAWFSDSVSNKRVFQVKGRLQQIQFVAERKITHRLSWEAGINFSVFKTSYYNSGIPFATRLNKRDAEDKYPFIHPLYTLTDNYNPANPSFTSSWIGLQAGLIFKWP